MRRAAGIPRIAGWRHGAVHPETCDDIGVFYRLVRPTLGTALKSCSGHGRKACGRCPGGGPVIVASIGARQAKAALAHGDGRGGDLE